MFWCDRLVSAGGDIKITKDGQILLKEVVRDFAVDCKGA